MAFKTTYSQYDNKTGLFSTEGALDLTTTPSNENKITASDGAANDEFGYSVAVGCGRIVVGARYDDNNQGSAYIFDLDGTQLAKITASDGAASDKFGWSVAIGSDRIVVGAYDNNTDDTSSLGSAYIFDLDGNELAKITPSDKTINTEFGWSVAVGSGRIVVGARGKDSYKGSAYIYDLDGTNETKITASDGAAGDEFGYSVAVGCGKIVVGAIGDQDNGSYTGSAYIFDLDGNQLAKTTSNTGNSYFGHSVAVGHNRIVVGQTQGYRPGNKNARGAAYIYDLDFNLLKFIYSSTSTFDTFGHSVAIGNGKIVVGVIQDYVSGNGIQIGSAFVYDLDGTQLAKITASDGADYDVFGYSVAVGSGRIVVGATGDDDNGSGSGSAYIYNTPNVKDIFSIVD